MRRTNVMSLGENLWFTGTLRTAVLPRKIVELEQSSMLGISLIVANVVEVIQSVMLKRLKCQSA